MKLLPHSNGLYKVNMKEKLKPKDIIKKVSTIIMGLLIVGFIYQTISNFVAKETLRERVDYTRVNSKRIDFMLEGEGEFTIVFDGNIGTNLNQWNEICEKLQSDYGDVYTFTYNRRGYGFSDSGEQLTPEEQAIELKSLLKKAGAPSPYILVGEEYGSLVLTEFAEKYNDLVAGVVLINPIVEDVINTKEYRKSTLLKRIRLSMEKYGSYVGFTKLLHELNLDIDTSEFEEKLSEEDLEEFKVHRTKSSYTTAVSNEYKNLVENKIDIQNDGVLSNKPYYLIADDTQEILAKLGDEELTKVYKVNYEGDIYSIQEPDKVITGIRYVIKKVKEIERIKRNS